MSARARTHCYMAEVRLRVQAGTDLSWIRQSLDAACRRLHGISPSLQILSAVHIPDDGRLSCVVRGASLEDVHRLFEIALLPPPARVLEVVEVEENGPRLQPS
jgi:hypothetical protein